MGIEEDTPMNHEGFEVYLKDLGLETEHEVREVISRARWVETTMNISLDKMQMSDIEDENFKNNLGELVGSPHKTDLFYRALCAYMEFCGKKEMLSSK